jgi:TolB-like protein/DNA-binding winged helix-turn-helix (wHTH) protein/Tfp pilus assembly protein PilF
MRDALGFDGVKPLRETATSARFAGFVVSLDACTLARDSGATIPLTRGEFALLRMFVNRPGRVISRDTLLDAFTNRRFERFDRSIDVLVGRLRRKIDADPKRPRLIVTVPGEGYRFDGLTQFLSSEQQPSIAVQASGNDNLCPDSDPGSDPPSAGRPQAFGATYEAKAPMSERREAPRLSIVVLSFANIGGDPDQEYFADGVTESLTTDLSRIRGAFVIGRSTAFTYKGKAVDLKQIGRELNVRYVLEGSIQRGERRVRVNVQLLEAETASHIWAERFEESVTNLFELQDEIVARLASQLQSELIDAEARRAERAPNPDSLDHYFQAQSLVNRTFMPDILARARSLYERALNLDPFNVDALVGAAFVDLFLSISFTNDDPRPLMAAAETKFLKALSTALNHASAHRGMGLLLCLTGRAQRGADELERTLTIDPNSASAHALMGLARIYVGRPEETEAHVLEALRLSPRDPLVWNWFLYLGLARACLGDFAQALPWIRKSIAANSSNPWAFFHLAGCLAHLGLLNEARQEVKAGLAVNPRFTIARFRAGMRSDDPAFLAQRERNIEGMRMAGVPEE